MKKLIYLLSCVSLFACEKALDYDLPDPGARAVVDGRLKSGDTNKIYLSKSVFALSAENPTTSSEFTAELYIDDATPIVLESFTEQFSNLVYYLTPNIAPNTSYRLVVSGPNTPTAEVTVRVLDTINFDRVTYDPAKAEISFSFRDAGSTEDYYMLELRTGTGNSLFMSTVDLEIEFFEFNDFFSDGDFDGRQYGNRAFLSDRNFNGQSRTIKLRLEDESPGATAILQFSHISKSFYRHELTLAAYGQSDGLFSEPVQVYSNISNGYGILASAALTKRKISL
jgi:hypothetical protein